MKKSALALKVLLLTLPSLSEAALPVSLGDPAMDAIYKDIQERYRVAASDPEALIRTPAATATWDCPVTQDDLAWLTGFPDAERNPLHARNLKRQGMDFGVKLNRFAFTPLKGQCVEGKLSGTVAFHYVADISSSAPGVGDFEETTYGTVEVTLSKGQPVSPTLLTTLSLLTKSTSKYAKASSSPNKGRITVGSRVLTPADRGLFHMILNGTRADDGNKPAALNFSRYLNANTVENALYLQKFDMVTRSTEHYESGVIVSRTGDGYSQTFDDSGKPKTTSNAAPAVLTASRGVVAPQQLQLTSAGPYLGVQMSDISAEQVRSLSLKDSKGIVVVAVVSGSPAEKAGIAAGDVLLRFSGSEITNVTTLPTLVRQTKPGEQYTVDLVRAGKPLSLPVTMENAPASAVVAAAPVQPSMPLAATDNPLEDNSGRYLSPFTSDGVAAKWVDKAVNAKMGSAIGGAVGAYAGRKALEQVPFIGGFLGNKVGAAAGRSVALAAVGGEVYMKETSDISFNDINAMARWLVKNHRSHSKFTEIMNAASEIYPELKQAYLIALQTVK